MNPADPYNDNLAHLQGALLVLNLRLHRHVLRWRATHHPQATPDELLGLYVSDRDVDTLLDGLYAANAADSTTANQPPIETLTTLLENAQTHHGDREAATLATDIPLRLPLLSQRLGLNDFEQQVVLLTLAPETDRQYERLFGYLNNDITRRFPTVALALDLYCNAPSDRLIHRPCFYSDAPLCRLRIVRLSADSGGALPPTLLSQMLKLEDDIAAYLLGADSPAPLLASLQRYTPTITPPILATPVAASVATLATHLQQQPPNSIVAIASPDMTLQLNVAAHLATVYDPNSPLLVLNAEALKQHPNPADEVARVVCQVRLRQAALAVQVSDLRSEPAVLGALQHLLADCTQLRFLLVSEFWIAADLTPDAPLLKLQLPVPNMEARQQLWAASLNGQATQIDLAELADRFRLTSGQIAAAAREAIAQQVAFEPNQPLQRAALFASCRSQASIAITQLSQPIESIHTWNDLVLSPNTKAQLLSLEHWVRYRHLVYGTWGFAKRVMLGRGLSVLFSGVSGTGKTMAAGILARSLELDLYRIDLSTVVSKYIGETEKNLSQIFTAAESANAILFFDEADALFGKRSEVKDAHDRYANIEVSYLLQRMEAYNGVAVLATNFRQNLDQAFARRLHVTIEFPFPQASDRERIWRQLLPSTVPQATDLDLAALAHPFAIAGGSIKNCVLTAAFAAAAENSPITMRHLVQAVARELEKLEQPIVRSDFGSYYDLIRSPTLIERDA